MVVACVVRQQGDGPAYLCQCGTERPAGCSFCVTCNIRRWDEWTAHPGADPGDGPPEPTDWGYIG